MPAAALPVPPPPPPGSPAHPVPLLQRLWPRPVPDPAAPLALAAQVVAVGVLGALLLPDAGQGLSVLLTGAAGLCVTLRARRGPLGRERLLLAAASLLLLTVPVVRSATWLEVLCVLGALGTGTLAVVGGRTWTGVALALSSTLLVVSRAARWLVGPLARVTLPREGVRRGGVVALLAVLLVLVFGGLFAAADAAFADLAARLVPSLRVDTAVARVVVFVAVTLAAAVAAFLAQQPPAVDAVRTPRVGRVGLLEWIVPVAVLDALFAAFVVLQATVLFGGDDHVLRTTGLTYAEYARRGFGQLLVVALLTLVVLAVAVTLAPEEHRRVVQGLLGALCLLSLVVVASALHRMGLYEQEFGYTRLRVLAQSFELVLGAVFVLLLVAGALWQGRWLPRAVAGLLAGWLLALAAVDVDATIARLDVERFETTGKVDVTYLSGLSADAVPELLALPPDLRGCALSRLQVTLAQDEPWWDWDLGRSRARRLLADVDVPACVSR